MLLSAIRRATLSISKGVTINHIARRFPFAGLAFLALAALSGQAFAGNTAVGLCAAPGVHYLTIQDAINAAELLPSPSTVRVCPGSYQEQLTITSPLTLEGVASAGQDAVVIFPPTAGLVQGTDARGAFAAQIWVQNIASTAGTVTINNLTVDGTGNNYTAGDIRGILFQDASGTVNHVVAQNQIPGGTLNGDQSGQGIMVETTSSNSAALTVENCFVQNYNKNGIVARYAGATLTATTNYVQGSGLAAVAAQNGIEIAFNGATGTVRGNTVINNIYFDTATATSSDILFFDTGSGTTATLNTVGNSQEAIAVVTDSPGTYGNGASIDSNKIFGTSSFDAIDVCTNSNSVIGNTIYGTAQSGVHFDSSCGSTGNNNTGSGNTIAGSACAGYLEDAGTTGNSAGGTFYAVPFEVTSSTASCTIPEAMARARSKGRVKP